MFVTFSTLFPFDVKELVVLCSKQSQSPPSLFPPPPAGMSAEPISRRLPSRRILSVLLFLSLISLSQSDELQALLKIKSSLQNPPSNSKVFDTWSPEQNSVCNFTGVTCNSGQFITEIDLSQQGLSGTLPFDAICSLQSLEKLSFGSNSLIGEITEDLSNCTKLEYLDLGFNFFTGEVPALSSLSQLKHLNLTLSGFSGRFPWKSLENLTNLEYLSLGDNPFQESEFPSEVLNLGKLYWLYLSNCSIGGKIPEGIGNLTLLQNLELADNALVGEIPQAITKLNNLWQLELYNNELTGKLPVGFGNLTKLVNFDASNNSLEGDLSELKSLNQLAWLQLFENNFSGEIPAEFGEFKSLWAFSVYNNRLTGVLPPTIGSWAGSEFFDVADNFFTGPVPPYLCNKGQLTRLFLLGNNFSGGLPESYASCDSLIRLRVNDNSLSGEVPAGIWSLPNLAILDLTGNQFNGQVGSNIGEAKSLAQLFLARNQFSGTLPATIAAATSLVAVDLTSNQFSGELPATIGNLTKLSNLDLGNNAFVGKIPDSLGSCSSLSELNLAHNSFSGDIPASLGFLQSLNALNLSNNQLSGTIPVSFSSLKLSLLDFSNNRLEGSIPDSLSIGGFTSGFAGNKGLCSDSNRNFRPCLSESRKSGHFRIITACLIAAATFLFVAITCLIYVKSMPKDQDSPVKRKGSWDMKQFHVLTFTESEIMEAIKTENLIGKGGSGNVYRLTLRNGMNLAVKHIWKSDSGDGGSFRSTSTMLEKGSKSRSPEYDAEVATLSSIRHVNVVKLYCSITSEDSNLLVYEYLPNGSLWDRLHTCQKIEMDWVVRYEIALGAARGLEYLHHGCNRPVMHRDVKSSNILLDEEFKPKIADFGLAKIVHGNKGMDSTQVIPGTHGYIAPEYAYTCKVSVKSDVYSFGVVLMELVTGKRPIDPEFGENKDIVQWVCGEMRSRDSPVHLVDSAIAESFKEDATMVLRIAIHCTMKTPALRPSMRMVLQMLEEAEPCKLTRIVVDGGGEKGSG